MISTITGPVSDKLQYNYIVWILIFSVHYLLTVGQSTGVGLLYASLFDVLHTWQTVSHPASGQNVRWGSKSTSKTKDQFDRVLDISGYSKCCYASHWSQPIINNIIIHCYNCSLSVEAYDVFH